MALEITENNGNFFLNGNSNSATSNFFSSWAESAGIKVKDWYKDNPGNRNANQIQN